MITDPDGTSWNPGEWGRFLACPVHAGALSRMSFDRALDVAEACEDCRVQYRVSSRPGDPLTREVEA